LGTLPSNLSIKDIECLANNDRSLKLMLNRILAPSYDDFIKILYEDIDIAIVELESNPQLMQGDEEDKLSAFIISQLKRAGYSASLGTTGGGNKDITVLGREPSWSWIGEAKIYRSVTNLHEAFLQLATRYRNADPTKACGGVLAYIFRPKARQLMIEWKSAVGETVMELNDFTISPCDQKSDMTFYTSHEHVSSGMPFKVKHIGVNLHFQPLDKSARSAKKYRGDN